VLKWNVIPLRRHARAKHSNNRRGNPNATDLNSVNSLRPYTSAPSQLGLEGVLPTLVEQQPRATVPAIFRGTLVQFSTGLSAPRSATMPTFYYRRPHETKQNAGCVLRALFCCSSKIKLRIERSRPSAHTEPVSHSRSSRLAKRLVTFFCKCLSSYDDKITR